MHRREFLQSLAALGTGSALPAFPQNETGAPAFAPEAGATNGGDEHELSAIDRNTPRIGIVAVGGIGGAILSSLVDKLPYLAYTIAIDSDPFSLYRTPARQRILLGNGQKLGTIETATVSDTTKRQIGQAVDDLGVVFILAGMDGKAGTEFSPIVADITSDAGILTVAAVMMPFDFENDRCRRAAQAGSRELCRRVNGFVSLLPDDQFSQAAGNGMLVESLLDEVSATFDQLYRSMARNLAGQEAIEIETDDIEVVIARAEDYATFG